MGDLRLVKPDFVLVVQVLFEMEFVYIDTLLCMHAHLGFWNLHTISIVITRWGYCVFCSTVFPVKDINCFPLNVWKEAKIIRQLFR